MCEVNDSFLITQILDYPCGYPLINFKIRLAIRKSLKEINSHLN